MTEAEIEAERLLPCKGGDCCVGTFQHDRDCPSDCISEVATALQTRDDRIAKLERALNIVAAMRARFDTSDRNQADAYYSFIKGCDEGWERIRTALAWADKGGVKV